ncbi:iron chelate uptake ABC transporter family permease subunit, partial [Yersinia intermedia]|uniref:iron chelate uptake ABC transporter family permease subunit n=1 Tax=Yersinia intermedia TaxID=631 RepID=UPI003F50F0E2
MATHPRKSGLLPAGLLGLLLIIAVALTLYNLRQLLPVSLWAEALWRPDNDDVRQMLFHYSQLPRLVVALLTGAGLGLVGVLFQQVLRNPLAEPATLGVAAGG